MIVPASAVYGVTPLQHSDMWYKKCHLVMCSVWTVCSWCITFPLVICNHAGCEWHAGLCKYCRSACLGFRETGSILGSVCFTGMKLFRKLLFHFALLCWKLYIVCLACALQFVTFSLFSFSQLQCSSNWRGLRCLHDLAPHLHYHILRIAYDQGTWELQKWKGLTSIYIPPIFETVIFEIDVCLHNNLGACSYNLCYLMIFLLLTARFVWYCCMSWVTNPRQTLYPARQAAIHPTFFPSESLTYGTDFQVM